MKINQKNIKKKKKKKKKKIINILKKQYNILSIYITNITLKTMETNIFNVIYTNNKGKKHKQKVVITASTYKDLFEKLNKILNEHCKCKIYQYIGEYSI